MIVIRVIFLFLLLWLIACSSPAVVFDNATFSVEIVDTPAEMARGLMFRESLPENAGMLFVFDDEQPRTFWMKNTFIPLDMIFIGKNLTVVEVKENVPPCVVDSCPSYSSLPAMYVLEVNAGVTKKVGIGASSKAMVRK